MPDFLLLLSGATPGAESRLAALGRFLPLAVLELSTRPAPPELEPDEEAW